VTLNSGSKMPIVGLGTWKATEPNEVKNAVKWALDMGYKHLDCAACYGNEAEVGAALKESLDGGINREEIFITSKLWNSEHDPVHVRPALEMTLKELQIDYLDLYLIHWPQNWEHTEGTNRSFAKNEDGTMKYTEVPLMETWKALEECVAAGLVKAIGLSNFNSKQITEIMGKGKIAPAVLQVEIHPFFSNEPLVSFAQSKGIAVTAYSPLGSGVEIGGQRVIDNPQLKELAEKTGKSAAQLVLAWLVNRGVIVIPKSVKESRLKENHDVVFELEPSTMEIINGINRDVRGGWGGPLVDDKPRDLVHPDYPFKFGDSGHPDF